MIVREYEGMKNISNEKFLQDLIGVGERIRDLCAQRVPKSLAHYTGSQLRMINRIYELTRHQSEGIQLKTLANVLRITPAATSEMVETLVQRGALERRVDVCDRRAMSLRLSAGLEAHFHQSEEFIVELFGKFFDSSDPEKRQIAAEVMDKLHLFLVKVNQLEEVER